MNRALVATVLIAVFCLVAEAKLRVAIHKDSCNSAALYPAYTTRMSITQQLSQDPNIMQADELDDSDFTDSKLQNYDVIYLGCGGKDLELDALGATAAQAIVNFVNAGHGLVISATTTTAFSERQDVLQPIMPLAYGPLAWAKTSNANSIPVLTINSVPHYITSFAITQQSVAPLGFAFYVQDHPKSGWTSLANTAVGTAECCLGFSDCGNEFCDPYVNQGILVKDFTNGGRVSYINFAYCGYEMFGPYNLRKGVMNQLFLNMFYWSSGKCASLNECNNHGACAGSSCVCETGWGGNDCSTPVCDTPCGNGGTCVGPNTCQCVGNYRPPDCLSCSYPYAGPSCTESSQILDPSFEKSVSQTHWVYSDSSVITSAVDGISPYHSNKMLKFAGTGKTFTVSTELYIMNNEEASPVLRFHYRTSSSLSSGSKLQILVDQTVIWETTGTQSSDWGQIGKTLESYATDEGSKHTITIKAQLSSQSGDAFYFDYIEVDFPTCNPTCAYGVCALDGSGSTFCKCDEFHSGDICDKPRCGDGIVVYPETCDDGNNVSGDGCSSTCTVEDGWTCDYPGFPCSDICGDGRSMSTDPGDCDDGNFIDGDGCSSDCKVERGFTCTRSKTSKSVCSFLCGDGIVFGTEVCDDGNTNGNDGCSSDCKKINPGWDCTYHYNQDDNTCIKEKCGDGHQTISEECDDGNTVDGDGCSHDCKVEPGWYVVYSMEDWPTSVMQTRCGDGITAGTEECDGGFHCKPSSDSNGCHPVYGFKCSVDPVTHKSTCVNNCSDHIFLKEYEECDDGNLIDGDGCSSTCKLETGWHCKDPEACTEVEENVCGDGKVHAPETCDISGHTSPGCIGCRLTPGWECDSQDCHTVCGDGVLTDDEYCDCGTPSKPNHFCDEENGCTDCKSVNETMYACNNLTVDGIHYSSCRSLCGNGIRTLNEQCDDNNTENGDGCSKQCKIETGWDCGNTPEGGMSVCTPICHDKLVVGNETCDEGKETKGCVNCQLQYGYVCDANGQNCACVHGDGLICQEEECDDGNPNSQGCKNGKVVNGWECLTDGKPTSVCIKKGCGNGVLNSNEECDDGNTVSGDGCSADCKLESNVTFQCIVSSDRTQKTICHRRVCGDGIVTDDEECDDGNKANGDGCSSTCKIEPFYFCINEPSECLRVKKCGDGYRHDREECDDGNLIDGDGCSSNCTIEPGYVCDDSCPEYNCDRSSTCRVPVCGDGVMEGPEECDDGNDESGDGCSSTCHIEPGYKCYNDNKKSICRSFCGDGMKSSDEECDDGNFVGGDGCSPTCKIEHGYSCFVNYTDPECAKGSCLSLCFATCGDGIVAQEEECDDGNSYQGDGCYKCKLESNEWRCKGEPSECIQRKCTLPPPTATARHILCNGFSNGVIDVSVNTTEEFVTKVWRENTNEPNSYQSNTHYTNLVAGTYNVKVALVGFMDCDNKVTVTINQPPAFSKLLAKYPDNLNWPSSCKTSDGWIKWNPSGGVEPYKFFFANRSASDTGNFENVNIFEFLLGPPVVVDANNCTKTMEVSSDDWPGSQVCAKENEEVPYLMEGGIAVGAAFVLAIIAGISYSCWSSKRQVPKNWKGGKR